MKTMNVLLGVILSAALCTGAFAQSAQDQQQNDDNAANEAQLLLQTDAGQRMAHQLVDPAAAAADAYTAAQTAREHAPIENPIIRRELCNQFAIGVRIGAMFRVNPTKKFTYEQAIAAYERNPEFTAFATKFAVPGETTVHDVMDFQKRGIYTGYVLPQGYVSDFTGSEANADKAMADQSVYCFDHMGRM